MKRPHRSAVILGRPVGIVPVSHFTLRFTKSQMKDAWQICGPSVAMNFNRSPLWVTIAGAYLEGLSHGYEYAKEDK